MPKIQHHGKNSTSCQTQGDARKDQLKVTKNVAGECKMKVIKPSGTERSIDALAGGAGGGFEAPWE
jgi:hypothetical protein